MNSKVYRPPSSISRKEFVVDGSDAAFRRSIYALVHSVSRLLLCRDAFGRELDLTPSQFAVLMGVAHGQGEDGITIRELAEDVGLARTHVTTEVGRLEGEGLLTKNPSTIDRRSVHVTLTPKAEAEIARVTPFVRLVNDALFRDIDSKSLDVAQRVARQLILNSEMAFAEIRRHNLQSATADEQSLGQGRQERTASTSRAARDRSRAAPRSNDQRAAAGNGRREKPADGRRSR
ncbi:MarR family winged helix-turn-helix transcriptional regulator [Rhodoplanes sp. Z2-YC6860]|uniref:MarR family winged helix-turn-helix transcriptional regulator n=1 Tax=Rhodoplanes sp. Z2-YC6860 TaxID=674703 RepID=UPI00078E6586|nr:MarR family transcriptional regulator [Rhodoplanes sp. Z2-YC6860]AMN40071.1 MarR family transcriptional regulator [Rhodoplanes sp. Z2-YC6860]